MTHTSVFDFVISHNALQFSTRGAYFKAAAHWLAPSIQTPPGHLCTPGLEPLDGAPLVTLVV
jgi:hypothetical protein